jgi:IS30 family transposase
MCPSVCKKFEPECCSRLERPPYVCNGCALKRKRTLAKFVYKASFAHKIYEDALTDSRSGVALTEPERQRMDKIVSPLLRKGQSPYHICLNNKGDLMVSDKTPYKYVSANFFEAAGFDLARKLRMRPRRKKQIIKVERSCRKGRAMADIAEYLDANPDTEAVEMDSVIGAKGQGQKVLLTIMFPHSHFMLAFIRDANTARSVKLAFDDLYRKLGERDFAELFPILKTDNGSEFSNPSAIEADDDGVMRTLVFYCDPYQSNQKSLCENNHRFIRMVLPKGTTMNGLMQNDVNLMMSHINSYSRKALGGQIPTELFVRQHKQINGLLEKLGISIIYPNDIILKPELLK